MHVPYLVGEESLYANRDDIRRFLCQSAEKKMRGCKAMTVRVAANEWNPHTAIAEVHSVSAAGEYLGNVPWTRASNAGQPFSADELRSLSGFYRAFTRKMGRRAVVAIGSEGKAVLEQLAALHGDELVRIERLG